MNVCERLVLSAVAFVQAVGQEDDRKFSFVSGYPLATSTYASMGVKPSFPLRFLLASHPITMSKVLDQLAVQMNRCPRKCLGYKTPQELFF
jgi:hypothetical protein